MTVSSLVPVNTYAGNSFCKKFDFDFLIESSSELIVQLTDENGITTTLKEGIDYSINEIGNKEGSYIIFPLETSSYDVLSENEKITLMLTLVIKQESEFRNSSYFNFNILEWTFDYIVRILQIINRKLERCVKVKEGDDISPDNLINDIKNSEINAKNWFISAKENAEKALEYFRLSKAWAVKTDSKIQEEDFSSKYYAMEAKESASLAASYVSLHYIPFCVNRGNVEDGHPVLLKVEGNILKTQGVFDITTAQGKFYASLSDFSLDISNFPEGKYNIFINPLERVITLKNNTVYLGNEFPAASKIGDYLFNTSSAPYDLEEKTLDKSKNGLYLVLVGIINITGNKKEIVVNPYNKNLEDFKIEQDILNNKVVRMFDLIQKDHILTFEEKEGLELLGEYVYKEAQEGRYGYPDFYNKCLEEYGEAVENQEEIEGTTIKINSNGHKFYDIQDKDKIDEIYSQTGVAWYYGIDTENKRIVLPRNDFFFQNGKEVGKYIEAGLPNITGSVAGPSGTRASAAFRVSPVTPLGEGKSSSVREGSMSFDASLSNPIYGNSDTVQPKSVQAALYMVVGNVFIEQAKTNIVEVATSENDTISLFTGQYFDFKPNHVSWIKAGTEASGKIYQSAYNELVNIENGSITKYGEGFKVIKESDKLPDVDYSLYWIINTDNQTFKTPLKTSFLNTDVGLYFKVGNAVEKQQIINCGEVLEELNNTVNKTECKSYITETYINGTSGYRLWSDGYCEQWGNTGTANSVDVTLFKSYVGDYIVLRTGNSADSAQKTSTETLVYYRTLAYAVGVWNITPNGFRIGGSSSAGDTYSWKAMGYIK